MERWQRRWCGLREAKVDKQRASCCKYIRIRRRRPAHAPAGAAAHALHPPPQSRVRAPIPCPHSPYPQHAIDATRVRALTLSGQEPRQPHPHPLNPPPPPLPHPLTPTPPLSNPLHEVHQSELGSRATTAGTWEGGEGEAAAALEAGARPAWWVGPIPGAALAKAAQEGGRGKSTGVAAEEAARANTERRGVAAGGGGSIGRRGICPPEVWPGEARAEAPASSRPTKERAGELASSHGAVWPLVEGARFASCSIHGPHGAVSVLKYRVLSAQCSEHLAISVVVSHPAPSRGRSGLANDV